MSVPSLERLYTPLTRDDVVQSVLEFAAALGLPITAWEPGSVGREIIEIFAQQLANQTEMGQVAAAGGLLDYSSGAWLTLCADQVFDVQRIEATFATGTLRLANAGGVSYVLSAGDVRAYDDTTGRTYTSITGGTLSPSSTLDITVVADLAGTGSNALPGAVRELVTPISDVTCSNPEALTANDEESDPSLRARCRDSMARASPNGPPDAYRYYALTAKLGAASAGCTKVLVAQGDGTIDVYCASDSGALAGVVDRTATVAATPLDAVDKAIQSSCVPTGLTESTLPAVELLVPVSLTVYLGPSATMTNAEAQAAAGAGVQGLFKAVPVGGFNVPPLGRGIFVNNIETAVFDAMAGQALQVVLDAPTATVPMVESQVAVLSGLTVNVVRVS